MSERGAASRLDGGGACLLVTGAPGAGKSTVSRLAAESLTRSALLRGDFVSRLVVSGHVWALGEPAEEAARQTRLCNDNLVLLARNLVAAGFTPSSSTGTRRSPRRCATGSGSSAGGSTPRR